MTVDEKRVTLRLPADLAKKVARAVLKRKVIDRKFSLNDWIVAAVQEKIEGEK